MCAENLGVPSMHRSIYAVHRARLLARHTYYVSQKRLSRDYSLRMAHSRACRSGIMVSFYSRHGIKLFPDIHIHIICN